MKFKMAPNSLFAILLRSPWWISFAIAAAFVLVIRLALPPAYVPFGAVGCIPFVVIGCMAAWRQWNSLSPGQVQSALERAAAMPWKDFAQALEAGLRREGYAVERLAGGAGDLRVDKAGRAWLIGARRWKAATLGVESLRELQAAVDGSDELQGAWCVTLGAPSEGATRYAADNGIRIVQGAELAALVYAK